VRVNWLGNRKRNERENGATHSFAATVALGKGTEGDRRLQGVRGFCYDGKKMRGNHGWHNPIAARGGLLKADARACCRDLHEVRKSETLGILVEDAKTGSRLETAAKERLDIN